MHFPAAALHIKGSALFSVDGRYRGIHGARGSVRVRGSLSVEAIPFRARRSRSSEKQRDEKERPRWHTSALHLGLRATPAERPVVNVASEELLSLEIHELFLVSRDLLVRDRARREMWRAWSDYLCIQHSADFTSFRYLLPTAVTSN